MEKLNANQENGSESENFIEASDVVVSPETGLAMVVIKPDAFKKEGEIIKRLEGSGLYVVKKVAKRLPDKFVIGTMYKELPKTIEKETLRHFNAGPSEIVLVRGGDDVLKKVITVTGENTNPAQCDEQSIRYVFGEHVGRKTSDGRKYFRNAVHRSKDEKEQSEDLEKFKDLL